MGVGFFLTGRYEVQPEETNPEAWLVRVTSWIRDHGNEFLEGVRIGQDHEGKPTAFASLHPSAEEVALIVPEPGRVVASGKTSTVGPGYHIVVADFMRRLGEAVGIVWDGPDDEAGTGDETGYFHEGDETAVETEFLQWLRQVASIVAEKLSEDYQEMMVSMPIGHRYPGHGPLITPLGPRTLEWVQAVASDPTQGIDLFPWWSKERDARFFLGRALCRIWKEVRWRTPLTEVEATLLMSVHRDLARAHDLDPSLDYPWREWEELIDYLEEFHDDPSIVRADLVQAVTHNAAKAPESRRIGYRRLPVEVELTGGWSIKVPGAMSEEWDENGTWSGWDGQRTVWFSSCTMTKHDGSKPSAAEILADASQPDGPLLESQEPPVLGTAVFAAYEEEGRRLWQLSGRSAVEGGLGICNIFVEDETERDWAESVWRSLRHT
ncbi:hypothetical protein SAMN05444166_2858 [Singulisphaera sp. GP187]|uniref:hypothetical protein n=1 Tax=Singulisphaera sp. GP187 TaxID=1882752 RepID=UPI00092C1D10|nr:hypothetical protein [Singulisphaera sp. GP187]SIO18133.1 hypothetical protein SAMN05444166_2858 [Singulisphaera sp. GP187]